MQVRYPSFVLELCHLDDVPSNIRQEKSKLKDKRYYQEPGLQLAYTSSTYIQCPEQVTGPKSTAREAGIVVW